MKTFLEWLNENSAQQKPILFVGNSSAIIPSDHEMGIKVPDPQAAERLKSMAHSVWYEGVGEGPGQGSRESAWVEKNLGVTPKSAKSYDNGQLYPRIALGTTVLLFSNRNVNKDPSVAGAQSVEDVIRMALAHGGPEGKASKADIDEFINICKQELGNQELARPAAEYAKVAEEAEKRMWPGGDDPGPGPLGRLADRVEKERRAMIVQAASRNPGLYFLGAGHLIPMKSEHGLPSDMDG